MPFIALGLLVALLLARPLNALAMGDDSARALGAQVGRTRIGGAIAITLLCGAATAAAGPMYFLGLTVPHAARAICGPDQRWVLAYSAVLGGALMLVADVIGRVIVRPSELQAGRDDRRRRHAAVHRARAPQADRAAVSAVAVPGRVVRVGEASRCASARARSSSGSSSPADARPVVFAIGTGEFAIPPGDGDRARCSAAATAARSSSSASCGSRARCARCSSGAALGVSGAVFQSLTRNPLGSPDIVGFPQGASVGALVVITILGGSGLAVSVGALARRRAHRARRLRCSRSSAAATSGYRLVLVGIAIAS